MFTDDHSEKFQEMALEVIDYTVFTLCRHKCNFDNAKPEDTKAFFAAVVKLLEACGEK